MGCHNGSTEMDYAGAGIENPHPFAPVENMACVVCHGGNNQGVTRDEAHVPAPPQFRDNPDEPALSDERLIDDPEAYFNRLTLAGMDKYPDYEWEGQVYTALDYLQFINPGDMRVVNDNRSCGTAGCHNDMAAALSANPFGFETGFLSGIGFSTGMKNEVHDPAIAIQNGVSPAIAQTQADFAFRAVTDPNFNFLEGMLEATKVPSVLEVPTFGEFNDVNDIKILEKLSADDITKFIENDKDHKNYIKNGTPLESAMREMVNITCGDCHAGSSGANNRFADFRASGCTGCHMPYSRDGIGRSQDPWVGQGDVDAITRAYNDVMGNADKEFGLLGDLGFARKKNKNKDKDKNDNKVNYKKSKFLGVVRNPDAIDANFGEIPGVVSHTIKSAATTQRVDGSANEPVTDDACAGCHQGSNRTALQFWGIRLDQNQDLVNNLQYPLNPKAFETAANNPRIFDPEVGNQTFNGRVAEQLIEFEDYDGDGRDDTPADIHFERGMGCIDCHGSRDVHGANTNKGAQETAGIPSRQAQHTKVQCETCHGGVETYAERKACIDVTGVQALCAVDESGTILDHVRWDPESGIMRLTSRLTGNDHIVPQTRDAVVNNGKINPLTNEAFYNEKASFAMGRADGDANTGIGPVQEDGTLVSAGFSHSDDLDCAACHASWNNTCIGCHLGLGTDVDPDNNDFFSNITGEQIALFQANADFTYQNPLATFGFVEATGKINRTSAGMKMFFRFFDAENNQSDTMAFSDRLGNGNNPKVNGRDELPSLGHDQITAHSIRGAPTNDQEGNAYCVTCHLTKDGMKKFGKEYEKFVEIMKKGDYENLDFDLLAKHIGANTQNQLNSPFFVHMATGLGTGLYLFDEDGCPVNPLDNNANRAGCDGVAPATRWDEFIAGDRDLKYNLDANVEWTGVSNGSSSNPMLSGTASPLRDGANFPEMAGPMGARLVNKMAHPKEGLVLDSWIDADGKLKGKTKKTLENLVLTPVDPDLAEIIDEDEVQVEEVVEEEIIDEEAPQDPADLLSVGRANWDAQCAFCHGANGEGGLVDPTPVLPGECTVPAAGGCQDLQTMADYIASTMPSPAAPCAGDCAVSTAALILSFEVVGATAEKDKVTQLNPLAR
jgi:mono/diheme cytochrome c family protein